MRARKLLVVGILLAGLAGDAAAVVSNREKWGYFGLGCALGGMMTGLVSWWKFTGVAAERDKLRRKNCTLKAEKRTWAKFQIVVEKLDEASLQGIQLKKLVTREFEKVRRRCECLLDLQVRYGDGMNQMDVNLVRAVSMIGAYCESLDSERWEAAQRRIMGAARAKDTRQERRGRR